MPYISGCRKAARVLGCGHPLLFGRIWPGRLIGGMAAGAYLRRTECADDSANPPGSRKGGDNRTFHLIGIGIALVPESRRKDPGRLVGLGLGGAIAINLSGGAVLLGWLLYGNLELPLRGRIFLWIIAVALVAVSTVELILHLRRKKLIRRPLPGPCFLKSLGLYRAEAEYPYRLSPIGISGDFAASRMTAFAAGRRLNAVSLRSAECRITSSFSLSPSSGFARTSSRPSSAGVPPCVRSPHRRIRSTSLPWRPSSGARNRR